VAQNSGSWLRRFLPFALAVLMVGAGIAVSAWIILNWKTITNLQPHSYIGLFLISVLSAAPIPTPTPGALLTLVLGTVMNPLLVGLVAGAGNTVGYILTYYTGRGGLHFFSVFNILGKPDVENPGFFRRTALKMKNSKVFRFLSHHRALGVFSLSLLPNPFITPAIIGLGASRFRFLEFLLLCWAGQTIQGIWLAYLGLVGLRSVLHAFGISIGS
jgi:membrane protein YqaA with SNARE-associated domain